MSAPITTPSLTKHPEFALSVAVVDTRRVSLAGARNRCEGSVACLGTKSLFSTPMTPVTSANVIQLDLVANVMWGTFIFTS
jgi:hypothetical protein